MKTSSVLDSRGPHRRSKVRGRGSHTVDAVGLDAAQQWPRSRPDYSDAISGAFQRALDAETCAEALDGLGQTPWWLGEEEAAIELRTKAFAEYQRPRYADGAGVSGAARISATEARVLVGATVAVAIAETGNAFLLSCERVREHAGRRRAYRLSRSGYPGGGSIAAGALGAEPLSARHRPRPTERFAATRVDLVRDSSLDRQPLPASSTFAVVASCAAPWRSRRPTRTSGAAPAGSGVRRWT